MVDFEGRESLSNMTLLQARDESSAKQIIIIIGMEVLTFEVRLDKCSEVKLGKVR